MSNDTFRGWFLGEEETDHQEYGYDGRVWAPPSAEEVAREAAGGEPADAHVVAEVDHEPYARLIAAAPDLLAACEALLSPNHTPETYSAAVERMKVAVAKARGVQP